MAKCAVIQGCIYPPSVDIHVLFCWYRTVEILRCLIPGPASDLFGMLSDIWFMHHIYALLKWEMFWILKTLSLPGLQICDCGLRMFQYMWPSPLLTPGFPCRSNSPSLDPTIATVPRLTQTQCDQWRWPTQGPKLGPHRVWELMTQNSSLASL